MICTLFTFRSLQFLSKFFFAALSYHLCCAFFPIATFCIIVISSAAASIPLSLSVFDIAGRQTEATRTTVQQRDGHLNHQTKVDIIDLLLLSYRKWCNSESKLEAPETLFQLLLTAKPSTCVE